MLLGLLSDTHGRLDPAVLEIFAGVDRIVHAGDICDDITLPLLETVAPVFAVRGNCDRTGTSSRLPHRLELQLGGVRMLVGHTLAAARGRHDTSEAGGGAIIVHGHTHVPSDECEGAIRIVNPGSASQGRAGFGRSVALLEVHGGGVSVRFVQL